MVSPHSLRTTAKPNRHFLSKKATGKTIYPYGTATKRGRNPEGKQRPFETGQHPRPSQPAGGRRRGLTGARGASAAGPGGCPRPRLLLLAPGEQRPARPGRHTQRPPGRGQKRGGQPVAQGAPPGKRGSRLRSRGSPPGLPQRRGRPAQPGRLEARGARRPAPAAPCLPGRRA